jgi:hypothetical protein
MRMHLALMMAVALMCGCLDSAAQVAITLDTRATHQDIQAWLASGDPRLVAWGATLARDGKDDSANAALTRLVEAWKPPANARDEDGKLRVDAMLDVLDALIVRKAAVSLEALRAIENTFPDQALILASLLPGTAAAPVLQRWYARRDAAAPSTVPRVAAMFLAKAPPPDFAASVLADAEERLSVIVVHGPHYGGLGSAGRSCGDGFGASTPSGWPPIFRYGLEENAQGKQDPVLVQAGGKTLTYHRIDMHTGWGSCFAVRHLNAATRIDLVAEMLGDSASEIPWSAERDERIEWKDDAQFTDALQRLVAREEKQFSAAGARLAAKGYLTQSEMASTRPRLIVTVHDVRGSGDGALPRFTPADQRTTFAYPAH